MDPHMHINILLIIWAKIWGSRMYSKYCRLEVDWHIRSNLSFVLRWSEVACDKNYPREMSFQIAGRIQTDVKHNLISPWFHALSILTSMPIRKIYVYPTEIGISEVPR